MPDEVTLSSNKQNPTPNPGQGSFSAPNDALVSDPSYEVLITKYQNAEWEDCEQILGELLTKYPESKWLADFKRDLEVQKTLKRMGAQDKVKRRRQAILTILLNLLFLGVLVFIGYLLFTQIMSTYEASQRTSSEVAQQLELENLKTMEDQAWALLQAGKPELVLPLIEKIEAIDPNYPSIEQIRQEANAQLELSDEYDRIVQLMDQGDYEAALPLLQQLEAAHPLYRDVQARIDVINQYNYVRDLVASAKVSYKAQKWAEVITSYEEALDLDPNVKTEEVKQQLLTSYLRSVISILNKDDPTIEEIQVAEKYYQSAIALIPQSKTYSAERERLQKLSLQLLATKYYQVGREILVDPTHTQKMVASAVDYLNRALALNPNDLELNSEVGKAQIYLTALRNFDAGKWEQAIEQLTMLSNFDPNYPNGLGLQMLYEAYCARGQRYYYGGFYLDARKNFESAEVLAYENPENKLRLFEVQIKIGNTLGKLDDFENAASYYYYAFNAVMSEEIGVKDKAFAANLETAAGLFEQEKFLESYEKYKGLIEKSPILYSYETLDVIGGESLVYLASTYHSTIEAIQVENDLEDVVNLPFMQTITIPFIP